MALDQTVISARLAARLKLSDPSPEYDRVERCVAGAERRIANRTGVPDLPVGDELVNEGCERLAEAFYNHAGTSNLGYAQLSSDIIQGLGFPRDLERDVQHYWDHLVVSWGLA